MQYRINRLAEPDDDGLMQSDVIGHTTIDVPDSVTHDLDTIRDEALAAFGVFDSYGFNIEESAEGNGFVIFDGEEPALSVEPADEADSDGESDDEFFLLLDEGF